MNRIFYATKKLEIASDPKMEELQKKVDALNINVYESPIEPLRKNLVYNDGGEPLNAPKTDS